MHEGRVFGTIDYLEQPRRLRENLRDNLLAPVTLAVLCREAKVPFVSIATGCLLEADAAAIADEDQPGFDDDAPPNFFASSYSTVKGTTDSLLRLLYSESALWFRIRMPITHDPCTSAASSPRSPNMRGCAACPTACLCWTDRAGSSPSS